MDRVIGRTNSSSIWTVFIWSTSFCDAGVTFSATAAPRVSGLIARPGVTGGIRAGMLMDNVFGGLLAARGYHLPLYLRCALVFEALRAVCDPVACSLGLG